VRKHCLVRTPPHVLLAQAALRHDATRCAASTTSVPVWLEKLRPEAVAWRSDLPGSWQVEWCLEVEPGANGAMAHLTAVATSEPGRPCRGIADTLLGRWAAHELGALAETAEAAHGPYQRLPPSSSGDLDAPSTPGLEVHPAETDADGASAAPSGPDRPVGAWSCGQSAARRPHPVGRRRRRRVVITSTR